MQNVVEDTSPVNTKCQKLIHPPNGGNGEDHTDTLGSCAAVFNEVRDLIASHLIIAPHENIATVLWIAHTYRVHDFYSTPRLCWTSPTWGCGKTRAQKVCSLLSYNPLPLVEVTAATLFRLLDDMHPTIFVDEMDTLTKDAAFALRGIINYGHTKGPRIPRCNNQRATRWSCSIPMGLFALPALVLNLLP